MLPHGNFSLASFAFVLISIRIIIKCTNFAKFSSTVNVGAVNGSCNWVGLFHALNINHHVGFWH